MSDLDKIYRDMFNDLTEEQFVAHLKQLLGEHDLTDYDGKYDLLTTRQKEILVDHHYRQMKLLQELLKPNKDKDSL